jgi:hypothetical protein
MRIGKRLASLAGKATPGMSLDSTTRIDYVATGTVCISVEESSEGGAHPSLFTAAHCIALAPELDPRDPLSLSDRLDAKELERVIAELRRTAEAGGFEEHRVAADLLAEVGPGDPDELPFRLAHREGRVEATALQYRKAPRFLSPSYHLTVTAPLPAPPRAFVAYAGDGALFARAHAADDAVLDTFVAPGREVAFVLVGGRIVGVSQENAAAVAELRDERVVMAEWATGGNVARWIAALGGK